MANFDRNFRKSVCDKTDLSMGSSEQSNASIWFGVSDSSNIDHNKVPHASMINPWPSKLPARICQGASTHSWRTPEGGRDDGWSRNPRKRSGTSFGGGRGRRGICPPWFWKIVTFLCFCLQYFVFFIFLPPPPRKSVKILPPLEKTKMTSLEEMTTDEYYL